MSLLDDSSVIDRLSAHLPEGIPKTKKGIADIIGSPQFAQALQGLNIALKSGSVDSSTFGINGDNSTSSTGNLD